MALPWLVRAVVTIAFAASGAVHLVRCLAGSPRRPGNGVELVNDLVHLLMNVEMVAMAWRAPLRDRWSLQLTAFAVATGWFLVQAIVPLPVGSVMYGAANASDLRYRAPARESRRTVGARAACLQHAIIAAVMTWMIAVMPATDSNTAMPAAGPSAAPTAGHMGMAISTASVAVDGGARWGTDAWLDGYLLLMIAFPTAVRLASQAAHCCARKRSGWVTVSVLPARARASLDWAIAERCAAPATVSLRTASNATILEGGRTPCGSAGTARTPKTISNDAARGS
jgi:hypothetical protein